MNLVLGLSAKITYGSLEVILPDQTRHILGRPEALPRHRLMVHDYQFFPRIITSGDIGLGESYTAGEWEADDLPGLLQLLLLNRANINDGRVAWAASLKNGYHRWLHRRRKNTESGSRKNIQAHYDLSNAMYQQFLDETMTYSSAYFATPDTPLAEAQRRKLGMIIEKAKIEPHHHVLEIGSGWGSFAIEAVRQTGCRVTTVTISQAQYQLAQQRIAEAGLTDKIDLQLCDYRHLTGQFDRIVSIEMIEAVGHDYLPDISAPATGCSSPMACWCCKPSPSGSGIRALPPQF
jgi:cyclopropane-fatty-acyl-phospholipid synthase